MNLGDREEYFNPKMLNNALKKITGSEDYQKEELLINRTSKLNGKFFKITSNKTLKAYVYLGRVYSCRASGCSIGGVSTPGEASEFFDYFIVFNPDKSVAEVKVHNYEATHGQEITSKGWLKQFIGYKGDKNLSVGKNVDAIAGATISADGIVNDVNEKTKMLMKHFD